MTVTQSTARHQAADVLRYVETGKSEDTTLDFKRELYDGSDSGRKDFVKDVTAFANSQGGHILIGVAEEEGAATSITPVSGVDIDNEILRLENLCHDCIEPRIVGIDIYSVAVDGGHVLVIKVPKSWAAPHRAQSRKSKTFYQRHSRSISEMDVSQLREAFIGSSSAIDKAASLSQQWRSELSRRVNREISRASPGSLVEETESHSRQEDPNERDGIVVLHIIPIGSLADRQQFSVEQLEGHSTVFRPMMAMGISSRINLQGVRFFHNANGRELFTQIHRNGALEAVAEGLVYQQDGGRELLGSRIASELKRLLPGYFRGLKQLGVTPPFFIKLSLLRVVNSTLATSGNPYWSHGTPSYGDNILEVPEVLLLDYPDDECRGLGKDLLDPVWNAYGLPKCTAFDEDGNWRS